ncbi:uncharacterized protein LOC142224669 [Haematobia irritans]|uniref:uncharacterized protein LOC142224669 n=1 Tax=Haematobia irritans TaxID=7368 RepID=UPI003F4FFB46
MYVFSRKVNMSSTGYNNEVDHRLPHLGQLDFALISSAFYKTSTKIYSEEYNRRLVAEILSFPSTERGSDALFITFVKSMRFQRVFSKEVCEYLTDICKNPNNLKQFQPRGQIHMFALFADCLWDDSAATKNPSCTAYAENIRGKDIASFLWCCSQLNCDMTKEQFTLMEEMLIRKLHNNEFSYFPDQLVESCLSLWILGYKSKELFQNAVALKSQAQSKRYQPKVDSRLTVLMSAAHIEEPSWCTRLSKKFDYFDINADVPDYILNTGTPYQSLLAKFAENDIVISAEISCPINGINILGILIKFVNDSLLFVEFKGEYQTLKFSQNSIAILRLKLQLLRSLGYKVKVISTSDLNNLDIGNFFNGEFDIELAKESIKV